MSRKNGADCVPKSRESPGKTGSKGSAFRFLSTGDLSRSVPRFAELRNFYKLYTTGSRIGEWRFSCRLA